MSRVLKNHDVTSLYPSEVEEYGYSSRSQEDANGYIELLHTRKKAKHDELSEEFLSQFGLTNQELNVGLKLPLNAYTGTLRASFNDLYDPLQGFSICTTAQCFMMQLIHDLKKIPTLEMVSANTDACMYTIEEEFYPNAKEILNKWQDRTRLELEDDDIQKIIMRDVNNYVEIVKTGENKYKVNYKGGLFSGNHDFKWNKDEMIFEYSFEDDLENNSLTIVSEAILKYLLFEIPLEETINNCNDIFRFQFISHLGSTYEKCVQESPNGDIELQRNNRIYSGLKPSGMIMKIKADGRRDSLANCPENPIVDNANELTIDDINKKWYIKIAKQRVNDFLGVKRMEDYKKDELVEIATRLGLQFDKKIKKEDLIKLIESERSIEEFNLAIMKNEELPEEKLKKYEEKEGLEYMEEKCEYKCGGCDMNNDYIKLLKKINQFRQEVQNHEFVLDKAMDSKLGGGEYSSIGQFYNFVQQTCLKLGLDFSFEPIEEVRFERDIFRPSGASARHLSEVKCIAVFEDIETGCQKTYTVIGSGSDSIDKSLNSAITLAFRKWFTLNFTPKEKFDWDNEDTPNEISESTTVKVPTYIPPQVKEEIKKEVVATEQHETSDKDDEEKIAEMIMEIRLAKKDDTYGAEVIDMLQKGLLQTAEIDAIRVKIENTYFDLGLGK